MRGDCWESWSYPGRHVVSGRQTATRLHVCEVRGDGVGNSAGPGEALANRRYGARGGVSAVERALGRSRRKRRLRPFLDSAISKSWFPRMGFGGSLLSETQSSQIFGERKYPALLLPQHALSRKETQRGSLTRLLRSIAHHPTIPIGLKKSGEGNLVWVRVPPPAQRSTPDSAAPAAEQHGPTIGRDASQHGKVDTE